jgi:hypothetical protein
VTKSTSRARYVLEFKQEAVRLIEDGQSIAAATRRLYSVDKTLSRGSRRVVPASSPAQTASS